jgi:hypothetical protein
MREQAILEENISIPNVVAAKIISKKGIRAKVVTTRCN